MFGFTAGGVKKLVARVAKRVIMVVFCVGDADQYAPIRLLGWAWLLWSSCRDRVSALWKWGNILDGALAEIWGLGGVGFGGKCASLVHIGKDG